VYSCRICHFEMPYDDVAITGRNGCICLRCFHRETQSTLAMPKTLRRELIATLAAQEAA
jgi:hypothetical protein